jgi:hypothetical protein
MVGALTRPDLLVCTDMGTEVADFIATEPAKAVFVHAKAGTGSRLSASALHDVASQATKNLMYMQPLVDDEPKAKNWTRPWSNSGVVGTAPRQTRRRVCNHPTDLAAHPRRDRRSPVRARGLAGYRTIAVTVGSRGRGGSPKTSGGSASDLFAAADNLGCGLAGWRTAADLLFAIMDRDASGVTAPMRPGVRRGAEHNGSVTPREIDVGYMLPAVAAWADEQLRGELWKLPGWRLPCLS